MHFLITEVELTFLFKTHVWRMLKRTLKLYCGYKYTRPCMMNRIWGLKQLWQQVNGHASFNLHGQRWDDQNGEGARNSKWKYMFPAGFQPKPLHSTTGISALLTARPRRLDDDLWFNDLQDSRTQINKTIPWQHVSNWIWLHVYMNWLSD